MTALSIRDSLKELQERIERACARCGREASEVTLIGASKTVPAAALREYFQAGLRDAGENYVQEAAAKIEELGEDAAGATWHFIGALQSNKARLAVRHFDCIHSVDRASLAAALDKSARETGKVQRVLLQVNVSGEAAKAGCAPDGLEALLAGCGRLPHIQVAGLMALPAYSADADAVRPSFAQLRALRDRWLPGGALSMGMSNDFEAAIEEGATHVRLGTVLFGARTPAGK